MKVRILILLILYISIFSLKVEEFGDDGEDSPEEEYPDIDECESTYNPKGWEECRNKGTYTKNWVCCFFRGTRPDISNQTYCADVLRKNISTPEKRKIVEEQIKNGTYWEDMRQPFDLKEMICFDSDNSAKNIYGSKFVLILLFLFFI